MTEKIPRTVAPPPDEPPRGRPLAGFPEYTPNPGALNPDRQLPPIINDSLADALQMNLEPDLYSSFPTHAQREQESFDYLFSLLEKYQAEKKPGERMQKLSPSQRHTFAYEHHIQLEVRRMINTYLPAPIAPPEIQPTEAPITIPTPEILTETQKKESRVRKVMKRLKDQLFPPLPSDEVVQEALIMDNTNLPEQMEYKKPIAERRRQELERYLGTETDHLKTNRRVDQTMNEVSLLRKMYNGIQAARKLDRRALTAVQSALTGPEGRGLFKKSSLKKTLKGLGQGAVASWAYEWYTKVSQSELSHKVQYGFLAAGYLLNQLEIIKKGTIRHPIRNAISSVRSVKENLNFDMIGKTVLQGGVAMGLTAGLGYIMQQAGMLTNQLSLPDIAAGATMMQLAARGAINSLGLTSMGETALDYIANHKSRFDKTALWMQNNFIRIQAVSESPPIDPRDGKTNLIPNISLESLPEQYHFLRPMIEEMKEYALDPTCMRHLDSRRENPYEFLKKIKKLEEIRQFLTYQIASNPAHFTERQTMQNGEPTTVNNLVVLGQIHQMLQFTQDIALDGLKYYGYDDTRRGYQHILKFLSRPENLEWSTYKRRIAAAIPGVGISAFALKVHESGILGKFMDTVFGKEQVAPTLEPLARGLIPEPTNLTPAEQALSQEQVMHEAFKDPQKIIHMLLEGTVTIDGKEHRVPAETLFMFHQKQPLRFVNALTGETEFTLNKELWAPSDAPPRMIDWVKQLEGPNYQQGDWIGLGGNITEGFLRNLATNSGLSGGSDPNMQLVKMLVGTLEQFAMDNPQHTGSLYHPEEYSPQYLAKLMNAINSNHIPPALLEEFHLSTDPKAYSKLFDKHESSAWADTSLGDVCAQYERLIAALRLMSNYSEDELIGAYANVLPFGATGDKGLPIRGWGGISAYLYGDTNLHLRNEAEQLLIIGMQNEPGTYLKALQEGDTATVIERIHHEAGILLERNKISPAEYDKIVAQTEAMKNKDYFYLRTPDQFRNLALEPQYGLTGDIRDVAEYMLGKPDQAIKYGKAPLTVLDNDILTKSQAGQHVDLATVFDVEVKDPVNKPYLVKNTLISTDITPTEVIVKINKPASLPAITEIPPLVDVTQDIRVTPLYQKEWVDTVASTMTEKTAGPYKYFEMKMDTKTVRIPSFRDQPGLAISIADGSTQKILGRYDGTEGAFLSKDPVLFGSTVKPLVTAYFLYTGKFKSLNDITSDVPGYFGLESGLKVSNANGYYTGKLSLKDALIKSRNVPFVQNFDPNEWLDFQKFLGKLGIQMTDYKGEFMEYPNDLSTIGTDTQITSIYNTPEYFKESSLDAYARAYTAFIDPSKFSDDPQFIKAFKEVGDVLRSQTLKDNYGVKAPTLDSTLGLKTGTVQQTLLDNGKPTVATTDLLTAMFYEDKEGKSRVVMVHMAGEQIKNDQTLPTNLDGIYKSWTGVPNESAGVVPIARWAIDKAIALEQQPEKPLIQGTEVISELKNLWQGYNTTPSPYQPIITSNPLVVQSGTGATLTTLDPGTSFDKVGKPQNGWQEISFYKDGRLTIGYVETQAIPADQDFVYASRNKQENDDLISQIGIATLQQGGFKTLWDAEFLIVGKDEESPILRSIYETMEKSNQLSMSYEQVGRFMHNLGLGHRDIIIVNRELAEGLLNSDTRTSVTDSLLVRSLQHSHQQILLQRAIEQVYPNLTLDTIFWDKQGERTPAHALMMAITDYYNNINSTYEYQGEKITRLIAFPYEPGNRKAQEYARLRTILDLYAEIGAKTATPQKIEQLVTLLRDLNTDPTIQEKLALGLAREPKEDDVQVGMSIKAGK